MAFYLKVRVIVQCRLDRTTIRCWLRTHPWQRNSRNATQCAQRCNESPQVGVNPGVAIGVKGADIARSTSGDLSVDMRRWRLSL
jgi:hypothetical protein